MTLKILALLCVHWADPALPTVLPPLCPSGAAECGEACVVLRKPSPSFKHQKPNSAHTVSPRMMCAVRQAVSTRTSGTGAQEATRRITSACYRGKLDEFYLLVAAKQKMA